MNVINWRFSFTDQMGVEAADGWPILIILTDRGEIRIGIDDTKFLYYGVPVVHIGEPGRRMKVEINHPELQYVGEFDDVTDHAEIVRVAGEFRDAVMSGVFKERYKQQLRAQPGDSDRPQR